MAAIYLRVSTNHDEQKRSPEHQLMTCLDHAQELSLSTNEQFIYNDAGQSGTEMQRRTEVQRLVSDARDGKFDAVLFTAISRFARDLSDALALKKRLETVYGIRIISVEEGYDSAVEGRNSEMIFTVHAMVAAHKSQEMSKSIRRGLRQSAVSGHHIGSIPPYGYKKTPDKRLVPHPLHSDTVRLIYQLYISGLGVNAIAKELNRRRYPTPRSSLTGESSLWQASTVNGILHNPVYTGTLIANKWRKGTDIDKSRLIDAKVTRQMRRNKDDWIVITDNHEAIIEQPVYEKVQEMLRTKQAHRGIRLNAHLLAGMMRCSACNSAMVVTGAGSSNTRTYKYIMCSSVKRIGKNACVNHCRIPYQLVLDAVLSPLHQLTPSPSCVTELTKWMVNPSIERGIDERISTLKHRIQRAGQKHKAAVRAYMDGIFTEAEFRQMRTELDEEMAVFNEEICALHQRQNAQSSRQQTQCADDYFNVFDGQTSRDGEAVRKALRCMLSTVDISADGTIRIAYRWRSSSLFDSLNKSLT